MTNTRGLFLKGFLSVFRPNVLRNVDDFGALLELSEEDQLEFQKKKLENILLYAYENVPYYTDILSEAGVVQNKTIHFEHFNKIPLLTKDIMRREGKRLIAKGYEDRGYYSNSSGGTTGEPIQFIQDKEYDDSNIATKIFYNQRLGKVLGEPELKLWGSDRDILEGNLAAKDRFVNFLYNRKFFNCYDFNSENIKALVELHNAYKPRSYWAYVEAMYEFALYVLNNDIKVFSPRFIVTSIGPLHPHQREVIKKAFGCPVYNQYGSREVGTIAAEVNEHRGLEVYFWRHMLEIVEEGGSENENEGRIVITNLDNFSMPLIRYDIGDFAVKGERVFNFDGIESVFDIESVVGRALGFFKKRSGDLIHSHHMVQQMFFKNWIKQFQFYQGSYDLIECRIVVRKGETYSDSDIKDVIDKCEVLTKGDVKIEVKIVDEILPTASGKYLYTISDL